MGGIRSRPVNMSGSAATFVKEKIAASPVVVFSKTRCPYCTLAKEAKYEVIELDGRDDADEIQGVLGELTGARTVPRVFVGGKCIGGGSDTQQLDKDGTLEAMLKSAGAQMG
ncbi:glutaredoxin-like [Tropilaelaps mercedesae]|uniref:Glutaredoxin-like n=1 Tax=Tropilaelaps mercedesae TaxID=418985 RepID=A0A1V9XUY1_9ACAR|nr:glutaredoxin-like [Tropilaelaps mercedesae]